MLLCLSVIVRLVITIVGRSGDDKLVTVPRRYGHYGHTALYYGQSMDSSDPFIRGTPLPSHCGSLMTAHSHLAETRSCSSVNIQL